MLSNRNVKDPFPSKNAVTGSKTTSIYIIKTPAITPSTAYINIRLIFDI